MQLFQLFQLFIFGIGALFAFQMLLYWFENAALMKSILLLEYPGAKNKAAALLFWIPHLWFPYAIWFLFFRG